MSILEEALLFTFNYIWGGKWPLGKEEGGLLPISVYRLILSNLT